MKNSITQKMKYKQSVIKFSFKYGVTKTAVRFDINRRTIYRWIAQYDGTIESLRDKSRKPKHHPNEHTAAEIKLIKALSFFIDGLGLKDNSVCGA